MTRLDGLREDLQKAEQALAYYNKYGDGGKRSSVKQAELEKDVTEIKEAFICCLLNC